MARARPTSPPPPWTTERFLAWEREQPEKYEYVDGIVRVMVGGTSDHHTIAGNVFSNLRAALRGGPCRAYIGGIKVDALSAVTYPDVVVTCTEVDAKADVVPERVIIVEVLSKSTEGVDRGPKWIAYQTIPSLRQYLLIAQAERLIEIYEWRDSGWSYRVLRSPEAAVDFAAGDARMTMAEIYEDTSHDPRRAGVVTR